MKCTSGAEELQKRMWGEGVIMYYKLNINQQYKVATKANFILDCINGSIICKIGEIIILPFLVRPSVLASLKDRDKLHRQEVGNKKDKRFRKPCPMRKGGKKREE